MAAAAAATNASRKPSAPGVIAMKAATPAAGASTRYSQNGSWTPRRLNAMENRNA